ncbi:TonB-dependent receptor [Steroidobacter cummioxidans]|uniref:TonB-dependent receptor n=1 Tax=Steroidobacter cummioxidans TaxID=1803913 RepID=UPI000E31C0C8|nr:TonB-dependent receptor [Steroidobacter cummioxidans]
MTTISNRRLARAVTRSLSGGTAIGVALLCATAAHAQQATTANSSELETVIVTGIRASIEESIGLKRDSGSIVEAISAEDIGKLPDTSIADSLSRLPGLTSQRAEGRASAISLRGTDPGFTSALLNGREQVSTGHNRSIEFDQYPSELLSSVLVYKTPDSQLVGQGLAGTIDLRTTRPLDVNNRAIVMNVRGEMNSQDDMGADSDEKGYRASFSYIDQFLDNTLGITFGFARLESPLAIQGAGSYEPWHPNDPNRDNYHPEVANGLYVTDGMKIRADMGKNRRDGAMAAIQWRPSDAYETVLDLYYTKRKQTDNARSLEVNLGNYPMGGGFADPVIADGTIVGGTLLNRVPLARNFLFKTEDEIFATGWNNKWFAGQWTFIADLSYSKAERDEQQYETNGQYVAGGTSNIPDSGFFSLSRHDMPTLRFNMNYADPASVRVGPTIYGAGYSKIPHIEDELKSARFDVIRELDTGWLANIAVGANYSDRSKDKVQPEAGLSTRDNAYFQVNEHLLAPTNLSYANAGRALAWDVMGVLGTYYNPIVYGTPDQRDFAYLVGKNWEVTEKVTTGYLKGELDRELSSNVTLKGNVGLQVVQTEQSSEALRLVNGVAVPFGDGKDYTDVLPALNLAFMLPSEQAVRVGVAKEIARARMDQLKASSEIGYDAGSGQPGGSGGNPRLDPWRAVAYDISYERYFGRNAYLSLAGFYKDLKTYIYSQTIADYDFSELRATLPDDYFNDPTVFIPTTGRFTRPVNGEGGNLKGVELSVALTGELFTDALSGFGTILSVSRTESSITIQDPPNNQFTGGNGLGEIPLPGLSKTVWNATLYYENSGFSARVATRSRSKYIGEVTNFANDRAFKYVKGDQITDAQLGYEFGQGTLRGLALLLQVNNVTNEPYIAYSVSEVRQQDFQQYGRQYLLGVNYRL